MTSEIIGREEELAALETFLDHHAEAEGASALVLEGEAGIGKSTLWLAGVEAARERGFRVLVSRPAEAERGLAHVGLGDLFENVLESVLPELSAPRRRALEVALLVEDGSTSADPRTLGVAVRSMLEALVAQEPVVLAADDVQWLDPSSVRALAFALRRLDHHAIHLLLARRLERGVPSSELERTLEGHRVGRLRVGPLSLGATHQLLKERLRRTLPRPTLVRIHEVSGGNPFYALELASAYSEGTNPTQPLRIPDTLDGLVGARVDGLPPATRDALLLVAAVGRPSARLLADAGVTEGVLDPAFTAGVIDRTEGSIYFTHPLLASVVYQGVSTHERLGAHGLVANVVDDPAERARHLALSSEGSNQEIAAVLEEASRSAHARGAPIVAAELGEHSLRLTPVDALDDRHRRAIAAARAHLESGEAARARTIALDLRAQAPGGPARAEALVILADLETVDSAIALLQEALEEADTRPALKALIHRRLAGFRLHVPDGGEWGEHHARASLELAASLEDEALHAGALSLLAVLRFDRGDADGARLAKQAYDAAVTVGDPELLKDANWALAHVLTWSVETAQARALLENQHRDWSERDELQSSGALWYLSWVELRAGRWALAAEYAERTREVSVQYGIDVPQDCFVVALVAAHRGELERARYVAEQGRALADRQQGLFASLVALPGLLDFWSGDAAAAAPSFAAAEEAASAVGWGEPSMRWWRADYIEALLEIGQIEDAVGLLDAWESDAARLGREWVLAQVLRCRGLVAAARADVDKAQRLFEQSVAKHETVGDPFGRARALLALGIVRRRARRKRAAREVIESALAGFEDLGAATWADNARAELGRIGGRTREDGLTPAERRVAALVAEGRTNREVAAALFLGERTVASHLTRIYAKLGVRSRTELARRVH